MRYPVNEIFISQGFNRNTHRGIDLGYFDNPNQPVYSVENGTVIYSKYQTSGGYVLHIRHDNGFVSEYGHLKKDSIKVKVGTRVLKGEQIALMGNSGKTTGSHLHLGLYKGTYINYNVNKWENPVKYLCAYQNQKVYKKTDETYKPYHSRIAHNIPVTEIGDRMYVRVKNGYKIVGTIGNGEETEYYGKWIKKKTLAVVNNIYEYTTVDKYL